MLSKLLFQVSSLLLAWAGLMLIFKSYAVPGVLIGGLGYVLFKVTLPEGEGG